MSNEKLSNEAPSPPLSKGIVIRLVCMNLSNTCSSKEGLICKMTGSKCVFQSIQTNA